MTRIRPAKKERETVEPECEAEPELGEPGPGRDNGLAREHAGGKVRDEDERCGGERRRGPGGGASAEPGRERDKPGSDRERQQDGEEKVHSTRERIGT